jgi:hypothetical protein
MKGSVVKWTMCTSSLFPLNLKMPVLNAKMLVGKTALETCTAGDADMQHYYEKR